MFKSDNKIRIIFLCVFPFLLFGILLFGGVEKAEAQCCVTEPVDVNGIGGWFKEPNRIIDLVKYFKSTEGPWGKGKIDLGKIMNKAVTQDYFKKPEWDKVEQKDSLKSTLVKLFHNALMKRKSKDDGSLLYEWEKGDGKKKIKQDDSLKVSMLKMLHDGFLQTDKKRKDEEEALAWLKKMKEKKWKGKDKSKWNDPEKREAESMKDYFIDLLEEAILDSVYKDPGGKKDIKMAWLKDWEKKERNEESFKDFVIGTMEQAIQQASTTVRDPSKDAEYFQKDKFMGDDGADKIRRELSKATLKEFLLYLKDSQEQFFYDFTQNMWGDNAEKIWEEYKTYELAKIEKAREDVGKLTYETMKELKEEPTAIREIEAGVDDKDPRKQKLKEELDKELRTMGLKLSSVQDCTWGIKVEQADSDEGQCVTIKESGRMIRDPDQYIYGQALKKARDFIMCYFAPWHHFSFGRGGEPRDGTAVGSDLVGEVVKDWDIGLEQKWCPFASTTYVYEDDYSKDDCDPKESNKCVPKCSTKYICDWMQQEKAADKRPDIFSDDWSEYKKKLCPSDQQKESLKKELLFNLTRTHNFLDTMPPEEWYYGEPNRDGDNPEEWWKEGKNRCDLIMENIGANSSGRPAGGGGDAPSDLKEQRLKQFLKMEKRTNKPPIWIQTGDRAALTGGRNRRGVNSPVPTTVGGQQGIAKKGIEAIIAKTEKAQSMLFKTGEGIAPKQYLLGWKAETGEEDDVYTINTGKIISPAKILTSKIEAAQQAQFDLAMKSWKKQPEGYEQTEWSCPEPWNKNGEAITEENNAIKEDDYEDLECGAENEKNRLKRKWYKVELKEENQPVDEPPAKDPRLKYECKYPVFNELTCRRLGDFETEVARYTNFEELPHELPAPSEDPGEYAKVPESYMKEGKAKTGEREPPPDFRRDKEGDGDTAYEDGLWKEFPEIYGKEGKESEDYAGPYPRKKENVPKLLKEEWGKNRSSERYYLNKYYKDITQLYEKPMSQVMCEWFVGEDMLHQAESGSKVKSTIFQGEEGGKKSKLKNLIYDKCLPTTEDEYKDLKEPEEGKVPTEK